MNQFTRRGFLRGLGVTVALPMLESLRPAARLFASETPLASTSTGMPLRLGFIAFANGSNYQRS
jgi:hypothetical protein